MKNIALGRYVPYDSFLHRLDPRTKLLSLIALMIMIFFKFSSTAMNFFIYALLLIFIYVLMRISHIKLKTLFKSLKAMWVMILFLLIINVLMPSTGPYFDIFGFKLYHNAIYNTLYIVIRLVMMIALTMILTTSTKPLDLTYALEWLLHPLKYIKVPVHEISMIISLALRFIPTLLEETERIMKAQSSRGVDFEQGKLKDKIRAIVSLIIPLFISAIQRSEELANAMEARGYDPSGQRTRYRKMQWQMKDALSLVFIVLLFGGMITLLVTSFDFFLMMGFVL